MLDLLKKASLTQEEIVNLDKYLGDNIEAMILYLGNNEILRLINLFNDKLEESSFYKNLISHLEFLDLYAMFINEDDIDNYLKYYELEKELDYDKSYLGLYIANYYFNAGNKDLALNYYKEIFEENFSLSSPKISGSMKELVLLNSAAKASASPESACICWSVLSASCCRRA